MQLLDVHQEPVVFGTGGPPYQNDIDFITIASTGDAINFGDLDNGRRYVRGLANQTRGIFAGGVYSRISSNITFNSVSQSPSTGNTKDFGALTQAR